MTYTDEEERIKQAYEDAHGVCLSKNLLSEQAHRECYQKHHCHYICTINESNLSTQASNYSSNYCLPLSDCTNCQIPSSSECD